jgi:hypothetical protein
MQYKFVLRAMVAILAVLVLGSIHASAKTPFDKMSLWTEGTQLRGANIWQRRVYPELDGTEFLGEGPFGPPYTQADFDRLATLGANYINLSIEGLYSQTPPYRLDPQAETHLDKLLEMAGKADLFAVISFRTGPGRSDFTFYRDGAGVWFDPKYLIEWVWEEQEAQDGWVEMWRYTAERYRDNPIVAGYDLMVEPNSSDVVFGLYDPEQFYARYADTPYDWNPLAARITAAIREVDSDTPILIGGNGWGLANWLAYTQLVDDDRAIYTAHQYEPHIYTHQEPDDLSRTYPGMFDIDYDGVDDTFDMAWLEAYLYETIGAFQEEHRVPVAVNEYGLTRWTPNAAAFMDDQMAIFEALGVNYAVWAFHPSWELHQELNDAFDFLHGADPNNHTNVENELSAVIQDYWRLNTIRPSGVVN